MVDLRYFLTFEGRVSKKFKSKKKKYKKSILYFPHITDSYSKHEDEVLKFRPNLGIVLVIISDLLLLLECLRTLLEVLFVVLQLGRVNYIRVERLQLLEHILELLLRLPLKVHVQDVQIFHPQTLILVLLFDETYIVEQVALGSQIRNLLELRLLLKLRGRLIDRDHSR